jgi:hypothetical protein
MQAEQILSEVGSETRPEILQQEAVFTEKRAPIQTEIEEV